MVERWIRGLAKARWIVLLVWVALAVGSALLAPNLQTIIRQTEQKFIPSDSESIQAKQLLELIDPSDKAKANALIAFHRDSGVTAADDEWLQGIMKKLEDRKSELGIASILSKFDNPDLSSKFVSKDNTTQMVIIGFERADYDTLTQESVDKVRDIVGDHPEGAQVNLTGSAPISKDFQKSSEEGLKKTEVLTVGLVLVILLVVFRSPIAPFVPLIAIGISFVITRGLVGWATELFGLPVSSFTESFLIAVLFGAGTDYCILIIQRFREELGNGHQPVDALALTMKAVGKTVIFSASTVFFAFFLIGFAKFGLYQSAAGVALGVAVTLLAGLTLAPALLMIFGKIMFWPVKIKPGQGHGESKLWAGMARLSSRRPIAVILVSLLVLSPLILLYQGSRSFDDLAEIDPKLGSVVGFRQVEQSFGAGEVFPVEIALQSSQSMRTPEALAAIEMTSQNLMKLGTVQEVRNAIRPLGKQLTDLTVPNQLDKVNGALNDMQDGVEKVSSGLADAGKQASSGTGDIDKLHDGLVTMSDQTLKAKQGLEQIGGGVKQIEQGIGGVAKGVGSSKQVAASMADDLQALLKDNPELQKNPHFQMLMGKQQGLTDGLTKIDQGLPSMQQGLSKITPNLQQLAGGMGQLSQGQQQAADGVVKLKGGLGQLSDGLTEGSAALNKIADGIAQVRGAQQGIVDNGGKQISGWYLPKEALDSKELKQAIDHYMSPDGKITKFEIVLKENPYTNEAMNAIDQIRDTMKQSLAGSAIQDPLVKMTGKTVQSTELSAISQSDFIRTGSFVLIGIYIVLALMMGSVLAPLYLLLSLGFNFLVTMGIVEFVFVKLLGFEGLSWNASFFVFLIIVALGVDYSIFLMARFKEEYRPGGIVQAMSKAMTTTGGVIVSAAVIMGGTFAALMFSGVNTLLQIGAGIVIGLLLYSTVFMGLIVPALSFLFGEANWWPSKRARGREAAKVRPSGDKEEQGKLAITTD